MGGDQCRRFNGDANVLHRRAVRTPLPDEDAERVFHENMMAVADARERKADLLADPDVPLLYAYEEELDRVADSFERRLRRVAGDDYEEIATAHLRGERDDRRGELASYYLEALWRIEQRTSITDMTFFPLIVRYPDSFTVNVRFATGHATAGAVQYESPEHLQEELEEEHVETYHNESAYSQKQAAKYIKETAQHIREEFPHPDESTFEERRYGGIVSAEGRRGTTFSALLERVEPDRNRFEEPVDEPTLVVEGEEAERTERELLVAGEIII